jgi:hypothetical protein
MESLKELELELKGQIKAIETFLASEGLKHTRTYKKAEAELPYLKHFLEMVIEKQK